MRPGAETREQCKVIEGENKEIQAWANSHKLPEIYSGYLSLPAIAIGGNNVVSIIHKLVEEVVSLRAQVDKMVKGSV